MGAKGEDMGGKDGLIFLEDLERFSEAQNAGEVFRARSTHRFLVAAGREGGDFEGGTDKKGANSFGTVEFVAREGNGGEAR